MWKTDLTTAVADERNATRLAGKETYCIVDTSSHIAQWRIIFPKIPVREESLASS